MSMKLDLGKVFFFILLLVLSTMTAMAGNIKGTVLDKQTKEPLTGATIQITGTAQGVVADIDGNYTLNVNDGTYQIATCSLRIKLPSTALCSISSKGL